MVLVLAELLVDIGDSVRAGQVIARLDDRAPRQAAVERLEAGLVAQEAQVERLRVMLRRAQQAEGRTTELHQGGVASSDDLDRAVTDVAAAQAELAAATAQLEVARADLKQARIDLSRSEIRAPIDGQVLRVHARPGEKIGPEGLLELGRTDAMYAVAEVFETDVSRLRVGQRATVSSPVLPRELTGTIDRIAMKVGRKSVFDDEPHDPRDARVVEVEVRLDDSRAAAPFTNLQVEVRFAR
jgi:HlyD family secretion protein